MGDVFVTSVITLNKFAVSGVFIHFLVGSHPPVVVLGYNDVIHVVVVHLIQMTDAIVLFVQEICAMERTYNDKLSVLLHARYVIAAKDVWTLRIVAKHIHLSSVITAQSASLGGIPKEALSVLHDL